MSFYRQRNPVWLFVPTAATIPSNRAHEQFRGAPATGQTMVSNVSPAQPQQIDYSRVTAKLREALDKQIAQREKHQSIISYAMDFPNAAGVYNDTIM
eukprot:5956011-Pleurochrysis_carterae.AAC.1